MVDKQGIKGLSKERRKKLEAYQHLFYLLQVNFNAKINVARNFWRKNRNILYCLFCFNDCSNDYENTSKYHADCSRHCGQFLILPVTEKILVFTVCSKYGWFLLEYTSACTEIEEKCLAPYSPRKLLSLGEYIICGGREVVCNAVHRIWFICSCAFFIPPHWHFFRRILDLPRAEVLPKQTSSMQSFLGRQLLSYGEF